MKMTPDTDVNEARFILTALNDDTPSVEPTKEQLEIAELAKPLAQYLRDNNICGEVIVSMNSVALRWEGFTARYRDGFHEVNQSR